MKLLEVVTSITDYEWWKISNLSYLNVSYLNLEDTVKCLRNNIFKTAVFCAHKMLTTLYYHDNNQIFLSSTKKYRIMSFCNSASEI